MARERRTAAVDRIRIEGLEVRAHHGVHAEERARGQRFRIDVTLELDLGPAAASDRLADTVDYGALVQQLAAVARGGPHQLIERLAGELMEVCLADTRVRAAEVTVHKPEAPVGEPVADVAVTLRRSREDG